MHPALQLGTPMHSGIDIQMTAWLFRSSPGMYHVLNIRSGSSSPGVSFRISPEIHSFCITIRTVLRLSPQDALNESSRLDAPSCKPSGNSLWKERTAEGANEDRRGRGFFSLASPEFSERYDNSAFRADGIPRGRSSWLSAKRSYVPPRKLAVLCNEPDATDSVPCSSRGSTDRSTFYPARFRLPAFMYTASRPFAVC